MCGIVGFAGFSDNEMLARMSNAVAHRGPDGSGEFHTSSLLGEHPEISLGVRRLAIIDIDHGDQPMVGDACVVVCNGEIYNYVELRQQLVRQGYEFRTQSDTEVLIHGFRQWGWESLLERLNGMYAFAIYDSVTAELLIARDRVGQKPLYYSTQGSRLLFASEFKALLESGVVPRELNYQAIDQYLAIRYVPQPNTLIKSVRVLPGGHFLRFKDGESSIYRYWHPPVRQRTNKNRDELREELDELLERAVERTSRSDVPVSAYLSAGVDSSLLVAMMSRQSGGQFNRRTFSLGFGSSIDESKDATHFASTIGMQHTDIRVNVSDFRELPRILHHLERPIGEPLVLAYDRLANEAAKFGKVAISGEGADELFAGYSFHRVIRRVEDYFTAMPAGLHERAVQPIIRGMPVFVLNQLFSFPAYLGQSGKQRFVDFMQHFARTDLGANYVALRSLLGLEERAKLYAPSFRAIASSEWIHRVDDLSARPLERLLNLQYHDWLQDFALLRQDKLSMAHGLEVRLPYLDHTIIEFASTIPMRCKLGYRHNKSLLREVARNRLPRRTANRKKQAFYFPLESICNSSYFQNLIDDTLNESVIRDRGIFDVKAVRELRRRAKRGEFLVLKQVMALVMLEMWMQIFIDQKRMW